MADDLDDEATALSDVDDDEDTKPSSTTIAPALAAADQRIRDLLSQLDQERKARELAEENLRRRDESISRIRAFAQDVILKRDDAVRDKDEALRSAASASAKLADALREKDEILKQKETLKMEMDKASQMMVTGIDKISAKVCNFKNFAAGGFPRSEKYTGMPAVSYSVIKRANEIVEELVKQIDSSSRSRDQAREQIEQRNYEIAIEVSQLEATIGGLKDETLKKGAEIERLEKLVGERDARVLEMEREVLELRQFGQEKDSELKILEANVDSWRPLVINQLNNVSRAYEQVNWIVQIADGGNVDHSSDSSSVCEMDIDANLRSLSKGTVSLNETAKIAVEKVRVLTEESGRERNGLKEKVDGLLEEKQHIGTLLRTALKSKTNEVLQVAEDGLREVGINLRLNGQQKKGVEQGEEDEVYTLAGALENTVKASQLEIFELKHLVEALRAESSLLKAHLDAQAKEISQQKQQIETLAEKEHFANENVEGLMMDIAAAEEEIARWKAAAEQEAAAGRGLEQEFLLQMSTLRQELEETKQAMSELENKLKFKEETAAAAMAARAAAETLLRLADSRSSRLKERVEELSRLLENSDNMAAQRNRLSNHRYVCWPWQWLGLNSVRYPTYVQENSNERELEEPLI